MASRKYKFKFWETLKNDIAVEFLIFLIVVTNSVSSAGVCFCIANYGIKPLGIEKAPNVNVLFCVTIFMLVMSYFINKVIFEPIIVLCNIIFLFFLVVVDLLKSLTNYTLNFNSGKNLKPIFPTKIDFGLFWFFFEDVLLNFVQYSKRWKIKFFNRFKNFRNKSWKI